jgi:beta-phosphoglucomutase
MNKKAFIFDLDGVIVDTARYHFLAWKKLQMKHIDFTLEHNELLKGVSRVRSLDIILEIGKVESRRQNKWLFQKMKNT